MKNVVMVPASAPGTDGEALIKEARRRQRRRYAATGIAVAAVLAAALGTYAGLRGPSGPHQAAQPGTASAAGHRPAVPGTIPATTGTTVLMWPAGPEQAGTVYLDNLGTGKLRQAAPDADPGEYQPIMLVGSQIVYVSGNGVGATDAMTGKTRALGNALAFAASATPGDVWLEYGSYQASATAVIVRSVPVAGGSPGPALTLPRGTQLVAGTAAGLLLEPRSSEVAGPFWLWNPGTTPRTLPYSSSAEGFTASPHLVAYGSSCANQSTAQNLGHGGNFSYYACRTLHVLDVISGKLRSFAAPPGTAGWVPVHGGNWAWSASEISPSGQMMAAQAVFQPESQGIARTYVLHLTGRNRQVTAVPSSAAFLLSNTTWSAGSTWLFYQGPGERMWAYQPATGHLRSFGTTCCQYAVMATMQNPPS